MLSQKEYDMRSYEIVESFDRAVSNYDPLKEEDRELIEKEKNKYGALALEIRAEAEEEKNNVLKEITKLEHPLLTSSDKSDRELGELQVQTINNLLSGRDLHSEQIIAELKDAIRLSQYEKITALARNFLSKPIDKVKSEKELELRTEIEKLVKEAHKDTGLGELYQLRNKIDRHIKIIDSHIGEINYGKKNNYSDFKAAVSGGRYR